MNRTDSQTEDSPLSAWAVTDLISKALSLCQMQGLVAGTIDTLVGVVISPPPQGKSHFEMMLVPACAACSVYQGRSQIGGMPAEWDSLHWVDPQENARAESIMLAK